MAEPSQGDDAPTTAVATESAPPPAEHRQRSVSSSAATQTTDLPAVKRKEKPDKATRVVAGYEVLREKLGFGSYASVWKGRHCKTSELAAIKVVDVSKLNPAVRDKLESEILILKRVRHDNIVQLYDVSRMDKYAVLILEFCAGGDLSKWIKQNGRLEEDVGRRLMRQLASGMHFLHERHLVHRDLKPQNLLLTTPDIHRAVIKIADFGFARYVKPLDLAQTLCGSPVYMAPEILGKRSYGAAVDLWSAGAVAFEMLFGRPPFGGDSLLDLQRTIEKGLVMPAAVADRLSPPCKHLLRGLLQPDPRNRLSHADFFQHPWLYEPGMYDSAPPPSQEDLAVSQVLCSSPPVSPREYDPAGTPAVGKDAEISAAMARPMSPQRQGAANDPANEPLPQPQHRASESAADLDLDPIEEPEITEPLQQLPPPATTHQQHQSITSPANGGGQASPSSPVRPSLPPPDTVSVRQLEAAALTAISIGAMAEMCASNQRYPEAWSLTVRGLQLLVEVRDQLAPLPRPLSSALLDVQNTVSHQLTQAMAMAEELAVRVRFASPPSSSPDMLSIAAPAPEQVLLECALQCGSQGATNEVMGNYAVAFDHYQRSLVVLRYIADMDRCNAEDRALLQKYIGAFGHRATQAAQRD
eukprot:TRINITY_DN95465_c0_g1_i1.p1 TRINITY_DN95465_c0_g1~~TRINITY_DN95465_c0_g1_i1.p1  ORF type:complete len:640 (+),score=91.83 TRINITY_DN95465_c0_g1_i1:73-1992(+)